MSGIDSAVSKVEPFWQSRLREMIMHVTTGKHSSSDIESVRVAKGWPRRGSVMFTRCSDGQRFRAYMTAKKFKVVAT